MTIDARQAEADALEDAVRAWRFGVDQLPERLTVAVIRELGQPSRREARRLLALPPLSVVAATDPTVVAVLTLASAGLLLAGCHTSGGGWFSGSYTYSNSLPPTAPASAAPAGPTPASAPSVSPQAALSVYVSQFGGVYATSAMTSTEEGLLIVVSHNGATGAPVDVARFDGSAFRAIATLTVPEGRALVVNPADEGGTPILVEHFTPGAIRDFLVELAGVGGTYGVEVSELSHGWQVVLFRQTWGDVPYVDNPTAQGATIVQRYDGAYHVPVVNTFAFNGALFVLVAP